MELTFLGTSSGVPTTKRNVTGAGIRRLNSKSWILVDCGEGTQHQVLRTGLSWNNLHAILITHVHGDHCYGLPGILASASMTGRKTPLKVFGPSAVGEFIDVVKNFSQLRLAYDIQFHALENFLSPSLPLFEDEDFSVTLLELSHRVPSYGFVFEERGIKRGIDAQMLQNKGVKPGPIWGLLQKGEDVVLDNGDILKSENCLLPPRNPRKVIIGGDNDTPELLAAVAKDADVLVHEATYTEAVSDKIGDAPGHSSAKRTASFAEAVKVPNLVLTHFSPRYQDDDEELSINDIRQEAETFYTGNLFLADDFDCFKLNRDGELSKLGRAESRCGIHLNVPMSSRESMV